MAPKMHWLGIGILILCVCSIFIWTHSFNEISLQDSMGSQQRIWQHIGQNITTSVLNASTWKTPKIPKRFLAMNQENNELAKYILNNWLLPPFYEDYKLANPNRTHYSQQGQSETVDQLLKNRTGGFFIEAGALSGEWLSNSLFFEKSRGWTGLLVEVNKEDFVQILQKRRHAYMLHAGLCPNRQPQVLNFSSASTLSGFNDFMDESHKKRLQPFHPHYISVPCFPLFAVLNALNVNHVDYFSLDTEGSELNILKTLPLVKIFIDIITVEYAIWDDIKEDELKSAKKMQDLIEYLGKFGYEMIIQRSIDAFFMRHV